MDESEVKTSVVSEASSRWQQQAAAAASPLLIPKVQLCR